jgi:hypothetical protein
LAKSRGVEHRAPATFDRHACEYGLKNELQVHGRCSRFSSSAAASTAFGELPRAHSTELACRVCRTTRRGDKGRQAHARTLITEKIGIDSRARAGNRPGASCSHLSISVGSRRSRRRLWVTECIGGTFFQLTLRMVFDP